MTTPPEYDALSDGDLQGQVAAAQAELHRRSQQSAAEQRKRMDRELSEIESGDRLVRDEHINASDAATVTRWLSEGRLEHLGYGKPRRRR